MEKESCDQLLGNGFAPFISGLEKFGATSLQDIAALNPVDFEELGMSRVQLRKLQQLCALSHAQSADVSITRGLIAPSDRYAAAPLPTAALSRESEVSRAAPASSAPPVAQIPSDTSRMLTHPGEAPVQLGLL